MGIVYPLGGDGTCIEESFVSWLTRRNLAEARTGTYVGPAWTKHQGHPVVQQGKTKVSQCRRSNRWSLTGYVYVSRFVNASIDVIGAGVNAHIVGGVEIGKIKANS